MEIKLIADAALIGYPNAGKSTLISTVSAARPKVADYPFTTLQPHLGVVDVDGTDFVLADIPGLVAGAAEGKGLGHEFLRHTERARVLIMLLDPSSLQQSTAADQYRVLSREVEAFSAELGGRPRVVAIAKTDLQEVTAQLPKLTAWAEAAGVRLYPISSATGEGVTELMRAVLTAVQATRREAPDRAGFILHRPAGPTFKLEHTEEAWVLSGLAADRVVNLNELSSPDALALVAERLRRSGIAAALEEAGVEPGDEVRIGSLAFVYQPDEDDGDA
jgi:GTP-binding protein